MNVLLGVASQFTLNIAELREGSKLDNTEGQRAGQLSGDFFTKQSFGFKLQLVIETIHCGGELRVLEPLVDIAVEGLDDV